MNLNIYIINAFAKTSYEGNPAAVVPLSYWLSDDIMQAIAAQNNLSETAFYVKTTDGFRIRWFTPKAEVDLCGHATLATAFVIFEKEKYKQQSLHFESKSGVLIVTKTDQNYTLDFPVASLMEIEAINKISLGLGKAPVKWLKAIDDYLLIYETEAEVDALEPDFAILKTIDCRCIIVSAVSSKYDFVNRVFGPAVGVNEDPVTGSAYTKLIPYWAAILGKDKMTSRQISQRGGDVNCELKENRVLISGKAQLYLEGKISI